MKQLPRFTIARNYYLTLLTPLLLLICSPSYAQEKVGINITTPQQTLHVNGPLRLGQTLNSGEIEMMGRSDGNNPTVYGKIKMVDSIAEMGGPFRDDMLISASGGLFFNMDDNNNGISGPLNFSIFDSKNLLLNLKENGNLGLGVLDPDSKLHVDGSSRVTGVANFEGNVGIGFENPSLKFMVNGNSLIFGNLRLGSSLSPTEALDVSGNAKVSLKLAVGTSDFTSIPNGKIYAGAGHYVVGNNYGFVAMNNAGTGIGAGFDTDPSDNLFLWAGGDERVKVNSAGSVIIGGIPSDDGATGYKLSVIGKIMTTGVRVQTTSEWPDYVFESNYPIQKLDELENFIKHEKHLPGFDPAEVMEKDGIDVERTTVQQQEWIEVNTLYILQLNERINELEKLVNQLLIEKK